jgi:hypothetical protein
MTLSTDAHSGFIAPEVNSEGIVHPDPRREKRNGKGKVKQQRPVRQKYIFVTASKRGQRYRDYFNPNNAVQLRVMGMEDTLVSVTSWWAVAMAASDKLVLRRTALRSPFMYNRRSHYLGKQAVLSRNQTLRPWIVDAMRLTPDVLSHAAQNLGIITTGRRRIR